MDRSNEGATPTTVVRARVHPDALKRVTRMYGATFPEMVAELLQNARRANASHVTITLKDTGAERTHVTIEDDGDGIADPQVLLSFGENGWDDKLVEREDAAGMGILSLGRVGACVRSRTENGDGWRITLDPAHFRGEHDATVHADEDAPAKHGTRIEFDVDVQTKSMYVDSHLVQAVTYYPVPVTLNTVRDGTTQSEEMHRRPFLESAVHNERWHGIRIGVAENRSGGYPHEECDDVNFHGHTLTLHLPGITSVDGTAWTARAEIEECTDIELVLPARRSVVATPFISELKAHAKHVLYRAMAGSENPKPAHKDWKAARAVGIDIEPAPAELRPWWAENADTDNRRDPPARCGLGPDALVVACAAESGPEAVALERAVIRHGIGGRMFELDHNVDGYEWFEQTSKIVDIEITVSEDGKTETIEKYANAMGKPHWARTGRPETITAHMVIEKADGTRSHIAVDTDMWFAGDESSWVDDIGPIVTASAELTAEQLAELIERAVYAPSDDYGEAGTAEQQHEHFERDAYQMALALLRSPREARRATIANTVEREIGWMVPTDETVVIRIEGKKIAVEIESTQATRAPA